MDTIVVKVDDLFKEVQQMKKDGMYQVEISIFEPDDDIPALIHFEAVSKKEPFEGIIYDPVEEIPENELI